MTIQTSGDDCRESGEEQTSNAQFEKWMRENFDTRLLTNDRGYAGKVVDQMWKVWQASRAAIEISMPPRVITAEIGPAVSLEKMMARIAVNGIKVKPDEQRNPPQT